jgi:hypothetical protein
MLGTTHIIERPVQVDGKLRILVTVEVFEPASTGDSLPTLNCLEVKVTLRLAVYRQSVRLGDRPLETHDQ